MYFPNSSSWNWPKKRVNTPKLGKMNRFSTWLSFSKWSASEWSNHTRKPGLLKVKTIFKFLGTWKSEINFVSQCFSMCLVLKQLSWVCSVFHCWIDVGIAVGSCLLRNIMVTTVQNRLVRKNMEIQRKQRKIENFMGVVTWVREILKLWRSLKISIKRKQSKQKKQLITWISRIQENWCSRICNNCTLVPRLSLEKSLHKCSTL